MRHIIYSIELPVPHESSQVTQKLYSPSLSPDMAADIQWNRKT